MQEGAPQQPQPQARMENGVITGFEGMDSQPTQPQETAHQEVIEAAPWAAPTGGQSAEQPAPAQPVIKSFDNLPQPAERPVTDSSVVVASDRAHTVGRTAAPANEPLIDTSWLNNK